LSSIILGFGFVILHKDFRLKNCRFGYNSQILCVPAVDAQLKKECPPAEDTLRLHHIIDLAFPHAPALARFPTLLAASLNKVLCHNLCGFLGLFVSYFV
jgi:hypothetical protein